jgi:DNA-binding response OmpR family regulator
MRGKGCSGSRTAAVTVCEWDVGVADLPQWHALRGRRRATPHDVTGHKSCCWLVGLTCKGSLVHQPRLLLVTADDVSADTVDRFFGRQGYAVVRHRAGHASVDDCLRERPDVVLIDRELPDLSGLELCRAIRGALGVDPVTPIVMATAHELEAHQRLALLRAGVWDVVRSPQDPDELVARVENYLAAKRAAERAREAGLIDPTTGLYNDAGLSRRCEELVADAFRRHAALACLAVAPEIDGEASVQRDVDTVALNVAHGLHGVRRSDVTGRQAPVEFIILAPRTDVLGAVGLARRLASSIRPLQLRVGYDAVPNVREIPTSATALIRSALEALHRASGSKEQAPIQPFRPFEHRRPDLV